MKQLIDMIWFGPWWTALGASILLGLWVTLLIVLFSTAIRTAIKR